MLDTEGFMKDCKDGKMYKIIPEWIPGPYEYPDDGEMNYHLKEVKNE